jgi:hypothetical protein
MPERGAAVKLAPSIAPFGSAQVEPWVVGPLRLAGRAERQEVARAE